MTITALRPHRDDVLIAAAGLLGGLLMWSLGLYTHSYRAADDFARLSLLPLGGMAACALLRRTAPTAALTAATVIFVADFIIGSLLVTVLMFTDIVYAAVLYGSKRLARVVPVAGVLATVGVTITVAAVTRNPDSLIVGVVAALVTAAPAWTGLIVRQHRDTADTERLRAEQTALLAEADRREAVTAERARMARELHDMVANHLSAIAIHSTAALSLDRREGPARDALGVIRANSVQGLAEMRRLIGLLRASGGHTEPAAAPTLDGLKTLVEHARASADGSPIVLRYERDDGAPPLPAPVELAAYRIVQESLTNALKHAAPGEVSVMLDQNPKELIVSVHSPYDNTAGSSAPGSRAPGAGAGLIGMRERAQLLDGTFEAGPDGTVWRVRAVLPT